MKRPSCLETATVLICTLIVVGLLYPEITSVRITDRKSEAKTCVVGITLALKAYFMEYGKWPDYTGDGLFLNAERNAQLMRTLCGNDETNNPLKIIFFEGKIATKQTRSSDRYGSGFHPETGAFLDTWGNPYRIAIDADHDGQVDGPYSDDSNDKGLLTPVIAWSLGKDGKQGSPANPHTFKGSDDVTTWR